jgi:ribulose-phosphate 3-epimerase
VPPVALTDPHVLPSVMSMDFLRVGEQLDGLLAAGARIFHVDVMDGHFVPNLTLGPGFVAAVAGPVHEAGALIDVHLMVERPADVIGMFAADADAISVHYEADPHPQRLLAEIRAAGCRAGLAVNRGTPPELVAELVADLDYVNCMAISPGFAGQELIPATVDKLAALRALLPARVALEVDGGVDERTLPSCRDAGANLFVSASAIFSASGTAPVAAYRGLAALAGA